MSAAGLCGPDGKKITLDEMWQADPSLQATYDELAPATAAKRRLDQHAIRIDMERQTAEIEARNNRPPQQQT